MTYQIAAATAAADSPDRPVLDDYIRRRGIDLPTVEQPCRGVTRSVVYFTLIFVRTSILLRSVLSVLPCFESYSGSATGQAKL